MRKIGVGRYSDVYEGVDVNNKNHVAIKILKPIRKEKINREIKIMKVLAGSPSVSQFIDVVKDSSTKTISLVLSY